MITLPKNTHPKFAAITGASEGLGKEFARQLATEGYHLIIIARRSSLLDELKTELESRYGIRVETLVCNLAKSDELKQVEDRLEKEENLEILVNNAGFGIGDVFPNVDPDLEESMIRVHAIAPMRLSRAALVPMCKKKKGFVINVSSVAAFFHGRDAADYSATKAYVLSFSQSLQCDVRNKGIRIQALCPGFTRTGFVKTESMNWFRQDETPRWLWLSPEYVVRSSLRSIRSFFHQVVCIPSFRHKMIVFLFGNPMGEKLLSLFDRTKPGKKN